MKKKIIAFYDLLFYAIICGPLIIVSIFLLLLLLTKGTTGWIYKNWYVIVIFAITVAIPISTTMMFRYCVFNNDSIYFHYFTFAATWEQAAKNIDICWNQDVFISEIKDIEIVRLTEEEKQTKVYYKHWFKKYLKINLKYGNPKYVYVGNYSNYQIRKIIALASNK